MADCLDTMLDLKSAIVYLDDMRSAILFSFGDVLANAADGDGNYTRPALALTKAASFIEAAEMELRIARLELEDRNND